jgi:hypothetical protein
MDTTAFGGGGVAVCSAFLLIVSYNVLEGNINGAAYLDNVFHAHIVPHFDNQHYNLQLKEKHCKQRHRHHRTLLYPSRACPL